MARKLWDNIQKAKITLSQFLNGLGIEGAKDLWERILEEIPSLEKIRKASVKRIAEIEGFAEKRAQICNGLKLRSGTIEALLDAGLSNNRQCVDWYP